jgi:hypothetical protein
VKRRVAASRLSATLNYHMLSDYRSQGGQKWDELLTQIVATLLDAELVKMDRVAKDGMKVRASAGNGLFRRRGRLEELLDAAREQVETLKKLAQEDGAELTRRQRAARERAARERQQRIEEAMRECEELQKQRAEGKDPHARKEWDSDATAAWRSRMGRGSEVDLSAARSDSGVGQRAMPQPRSPAHARTRPTAMSHRRITVCNHS